MGFMATQNATVSRSKIHNTDRGKKCKMATDSSSTTILVGTFHVLFSSGNYRLGSYLSNAGRIGWIFDREVADSTNTTCAKTCHIKMTVPATNVLAADVFVTGIFY